MNISVEILLLMVVSCGFFDLKVFQPLVRDNMNVVTYLLLLAFVFIRNMGFSFRSGIASKLKPMWWLIIGVLISFIPAYLYYGQHLYHSLTVYRHFLGYFAFFLFLSVRPSRDELKTATYAFTIIYLFVALYVSYINQASVVFTPEDDRQFIPEGDFIHFIPGNHFLMLAFIFALDDIRRDKVTPRLMSILLGVFLVIFLTQSRTLLISALVVGIFAAMADRSAKRRLTMGTFIIAGLAVVVLFAWRYVDALVVETLEQLGDKDYNRVKSFMYFFSGENGTMSYVWGNGFISGKVNPIMANLRQEGIFHSDLGLIGFWNQFGLIPVITVLVICFKGLSSLRSFDVRANALNILICAMTLSYFRDFAYSLWLCMFWYLYSEDPVYDIRKKIHDAEVAMRAMRRFRSIRN